LGNISVSVYGKAFGVVGHQNKINTESVNGQLKDYSKLLADKKDTKTELLKKDIEILKTSKCIAIKFKK
jgi:hypothetical protein